MKARQNDNQDAKHGKVTTRPSKRRKQKRGRPANYRGATPEQVAEKVLRVRVQPGNAVEAVRQPITRHFDPSIGPAGAWAGPSW